MVVGYRTLTGLLYATVGAVFAAESHLEPSGLQSTPLDLSPFYNNKAFGTYPGETSFDTLGQSYPAPDLGTPYYTSSDTGIVYSFPGYTGPDKSDNVIVDGQTITVSAGSYFSASFLISEDKQEAIVSGNVTFTYTDNSTSVYELRSLDWFSFLTINRGELIFPSRFTATGVDYNASHIFERSAALSPGKELRAISLPKATNASDGRLHVFAISLWTGSSVVDVQSIRPTQKWISSGVQAVEITLNNAGSECVAGDGLALTLSGDSLQTTGEGHLKRLCPGDQKVVTIGVETLETPSEAINVSVILNYDGSERKTEFSDVQFGLMEWTTDLENLAKHESPQWFNDGKYGIFIHWGPYAVTGWGNSSPHESYAEWFWWYTTHHPQADASDFYDYRLRTYGKDWAYDDTFPNFTASAYDPKEWVDLIADAGAKYFVITSKHHDGFAIFDPGNSSNRSALNYGPKRDLMGELFDAAATYQPQLKRGTYFSLPEWFNPDFGPYGFDQFDPALVPGTTSWPGVPATNPYTGVVEPYTGHIPVDDFLEDVMLPQMNTLAYTYGTDIMWCDCGASNVTATFASSWFNAARQQDRQVAINSRCGVAQAADFDTPEYMRFGSAQRRKWESNQGMDPYSYGYNQATPAEAYMNASTLIYTLVDIVSKNGNLLLDIGPRADGSIVQEEVDRLREAGRWIKSHGEAVFDTTYWFVQSEIPGGPDVRFTQTEEAFYVLFLERPVVKDGVVDIAAPVPVLEGDKVSLLAVEGGEKLAWKVIGQGSQTVLKIEVTDVLLDKEEFCWVFKIGYA